MEEVIGRLSREGIGVQRLSVSHGFHSPQMEEIEEEFAAAAGEVRWKEPRLVLISSVTGRALSAGEMSEPGYWRRQVREPVRFQEGMEALAGYQTFVEAGPGSTLSGLGQQCLEAGERLVGAVAAQESWGMGADAGGSGFLVCAGGGSELGGL